jgi:hypothetical protein
MLRFRVLKFMFWVRLMSWSKCYGLILMSNGLISWFLNDFVRNNDFEINWFKWCIEDQVMKNLVLEPLVKEIIV